MAEPDPAASGLRDPVRAARSLAAVALGFEAFALLMAIVPMRMLLDDPAPATWAIVVLVAACVALAGMSRRTWVWPAGALVQVALIALGALSFARPEQWNWSLGAAGLVFGAVWAYCWHVKTRLDRPPKR
ncbi:hypothetical protein GCM10029992_65490 [Glycomyces albus]